MTILKYDDVIKKQRHLGYYFGLFRRSYVVPYSCKASQSGRNSFMIYDGGPFSQTPGQLMSKTPKLVRVKLWQRWLNSGLCFADGSECYKVIAVASIYTVLTCGFGGKDPYRCCLIAGTYPEAFCYRPADMTSQIFIPN